MRRTSTTYGVSSGNPRNIDPTANPRKTTTRLTGLLIARPSIAAQSPVSIVNASEVEIVSEPTPVNAIAREPKGRKPKKPMASFDEDEIVQSENESPVYFKYREQITQKIMDASVPNTTAIILGRYLTNVAILGVGYPSSIMDSIQPFMGF